MNLMFWVTERCNLNCDYCYVKKQPKTMSLETAEAAFVYFQKMLSERKLQLGEIHVGFHGGEPLLNFPVIRFLRDKFQAEYGDCIRYFSLTTNGTVFDKDMFAYLSKNVELSVSIDGNRRTNDLKRHYCDGRSSYSDTIRTLDYLKRQGTACRVRMTVNQETMDTLAENYIYLDKMGYGTVTFAINMYDHWNAKNMENYSRQMETIMDYLYREKPEESKYFLYNLIQCNFRRRSYCDGGTTNFHISPDGDLYPCIASMGDREFLLGDIFRGVDQTALKRFQHINEQPVAGCGGCDFQQHCASQVCKVINKEYTGDYYRPPFAACEERKVFYKLYDKYGSILEKFDA